MKCVGQFKQYSLASTQEDNNLMLNFMLIAGEAATHLNTKNAAANLLLSSTYIQ